MASPVPAKSQPLHNFSLPHLKWKKNHTTNNQHRGRGKLADSSPPHQSPPTTGANASWWQPPPSSSARLQPSPSYASRRKPSPSNVTRRQSPMLDSARKQSPIRDSESESDLKHKNSAYEGGSVLISDHIIEKSGKKSTEPDKFVVAGEKGKRSKICIRFRKNKPDDAIQDEGQERAFTVEGEEEESLPKTWNLRPRRPLNKQSNGIGNGNGNGGTSKLGGCWLQENKGQENRESELSSVEKNKKFSIALSRGEIEEDIYALTGSKPSRRPKKRPRTIQKQLDTLFPGLWLGSITPDSYRVSEAPAKG